MNDIEEVKRKLKGSGMKLTTQRIAIVQILQYNKSHPTAMDIYRKLKLKQPTVSFTTVYNTLELLTHIGEIKKLTLDFERAHYDPDMSQHHHAICLKCGVIFDIQQSFELPMDKVTSDDFPLITGFHIDFWGYCGKCKDSVKDS
jgi:Fur family peroxide stress response transcriptional regulator